MTYGKFRKNLKLFFFFENLKNHEKINFYFFENFWNFFEVDKKTPEDPISHILRIFFLFSQKKCFFKGCPKKQLFCSRELFFWDTLWDFAL